MTDKRRTFGICRDLTREQWLAAAVKLFPKQTPAQHEQMWEAAQKAVRENRAFYERRVSHARLD